MGETKVVIDTNVLVSAAGWGGVPAVVLEIIRVRGWRIVLSSAQTDEITRVISYASLFFTADEQATAISLLSGISEYVAVTGRVRVVRHSGDNALLEASFIAGATYLITGDRELLKLGHFGRTKVITPREFLNLINA